MATFVSVQCECCGEWLHPDLTEICVDCADNLCAACVVETGHRLVHEDALPDEAAAMPLGWDYLRCAHTPYTIHGDE